MTSKMSDMHNAYGVNVILWSIGTGERIHLTFPKGVTQIPLRVLLGAHEVTAFARLLPLAGAKGNEDMQVVIMAPDPMPNTVVPSIPIPASIAPSRVAGTERGPDKFPMVDATLPPVEDPAPRPEGDGLPVHGPTTKEEVGTESDETLLGAPKDKEVPEREVSESELEEALRSKLPQMEGFEDGLPVTEAVSHPKAPNQGISVMTGGEVASKEDLLGKQKGKDGKPSKGGK